MCGKHLFKRLGMSMLVAMSMMALNASAAQAKWLLRSNGSLANAMILEASSLGGTLSVEGLGLEIECGGGVGNLGFARLNEGADLVIGAEIGFTGCSVVGFEEFCEVHSFGQLDGTIMVEGNGQVKMSGSETYALLEEEEFTEVIVSDPFEICPFTNVDGRVNGSMRLTFLSAATEKQLHSIELGDQELFYGGESALLHNGGGFTILGSATEEQGFAWAIQLTGL